MITGIDHVVILVDDLPAAIRRYTSLGLTAEPGGQHPGAGTENALIPLADGTYLELLAARDRMLAAKHRLWQRADGRMRAPGEFGGFMLASDHVERDAARLRNDGMSIDGPRAGARLRPDGQRVQWRLLFPDRKELPALIEDDTPRSLRVPAPIRGMCLRTRFDEVAVVVGDLTASAAACAQLLGVPAGRENPTADGREVRFQTATGGISLFEPGADTAGRRDLDRTGSGVYAVTLSVEERWIESPVLRAAIEAQREARVVDLSEAAGIRLLLRVRPGLA